MIKTLIFSTVFVSASIASGQSILQPNYINPFIKKMSKRIRYHPFNRAANTTSIKNFNLFKNRTLSLNSSVELLLRQGSMNPLIKLNQVGSEIKNIRGVVTKEYQFMVNIIPVCGYLLKAHDTGLDSPIVSGKVPAFDIGFSLYEPSDFPQKEELKDTLAQALNLDPDDISTKKSSLCLQYVDGGLMPALNVTLTAGGLPFNAIASRHEVYSVENQYFSIAGKVKGYTKNPIDGEEIVIGLDFTGDSHMTNQYFVTDTGETINRALSNTHEFIYNNTDEEYGEANAFLHANTMYSWFKGLGYQWDTAQLTLRVRQNIPTYQGDEVGSPNNALYMPSGLSGTGGPMIAVADGDGDILENLAFDSDVVSHEFGHHIIFKTLKSTQQVEVKTGPSENDNHSAALHEGLADFFAFAHTGDTCLGESICPSGTPACWIMTPTQQCLRSGATDIVYNTAGYWNLNNAFHLKGQVVSGMLMDAMALEGVDTIEFTKLVYNALTYLPSSSTYADLIVGLMASDKELFQGKYGCHIVAVAEARGFKYATDENITDCKNFANTPKKTNAASGSDSAITDNSNTAVEQGNVENSSSSSRSKGGDGICGVVGTSNSSIPFNIVILLIMFAPVLFLKQPIPVEIKKK